MSEIQTKEFDPSEDNPFVGIASNVARRMSGEQISESVVVPVAQPEGRRKFRAPTKGEAALALLAAGSITVGVAGIAHLEGGSDSPDRGVVDTSVNSITLNENATVRLDPTVDDDVLGPNSVLHLDTPVEIDITRDIRVLEGTNNGTWYGIELEDLAEIVPSVKDTHDNDHLVWVNEQGIESIQRTE